MDRFSEMEVFARVVEDGAFSSAARTLNLTPSGVSKIIARLEDRLGVLLFKRNSRSMALTPEGQSYYARVLEVLAALSDAEASINNAERDSSGVLRVYTTLSLACHQIAPLMPEFVERFPRLQVEFHTGSGPLRSLDSSMDVAIYPYDMQDCSMVARRIATTQWLLVASPEYLAKRGTPIRPSELVNHTCMNFAMEVPCNNWPVWDAEEEKIVRFAANPASAATDAEMLLHMVRAGVGIARMHDYHIARDLAAGTLVKLFPHESDRKQNIYAIYQSRRHLASRARLFLDFLEEKFAPYRDSWEQPKASSASASSRLARVA